jgi:hypothetical protein
MLARPLTEEEDIVRAMEDQPAWARAIWATAERRLLLSLGVLAVGAWMLVSAISDPDEFFTRGRMAAGFVAAPLLMFMFGLQAVEAIGDLVHQRNSIPVFHRVGRWLGRRGLPLIGLYLVVMVLFLKGLID